VCPLDHALGQPLVQELAFQKECDDPLAEARAHLAQIDGRDVDESALSVKPFLHEQAVPVGIPSSIFSRALEYDDGVAEDGFSGCCCCEILYQPIDEAADHPMNPAVVAEEDAEHLGNGEDELAVGQPQQKLLVHVLAKQKGPFLRARGAEMEDLTTEGAKVLASASRIGALGIALGPWQAADLTDKHTLSTLKPGRGWSPPR
jgi:hypothetical protein